MAAKGFLSYWMLPVLSSLVWLGMLLGMLLHWIIDTRSVHYPTMDTGTIAYISDIGAHELKPLFIAGACVMTITLDLSFAAERWLRHTGRLVPNSTLIEKILSMASIVFAIVGTAGLILLSIFDTARYPRLHDVFLLLFIGGYLLSAIFICWEYQRLGIHNRNHPVLRASFWVKLAFVIIELLLAIVFVSANFTKHVNVAAIFEWTIAFVFTFYILSFIIDLLPAVRTKSRTARFVKPNEGGMESAYSMDASNGHERPNYQNGYQRSTPQSNF